MAESAGATVSPGPLLRSYKGVPSRTYDEARYVRWEVVLVVTVTAVLTFPSWWWVIVPSGGIVGALLFRLPKALRGWLDSQRWSRFPAWSGDTSGEWRLARVCGVVEDNEARFQAPGGRYVVCARTIIKDADKSGKATGTAREEMRTVPFRVRHASGSLLVAASEVEVFDRPTPLSLTHAQRQRLGAPTRGLGFRGSVLQSTIEVGDQVELVGFIGNEVSPGGQAALPRGVPMQPGVAPAWKNRVWVRRCRPARD